jgi:hypothetical protein
MPENSHNHVITDSVHVEQATPSSVYVNTFIWLEIIIIHVILFVAFNTYKKYRAAVQRQKIAALEKLWHLDIDKKNV